MGEEMRRGTTAGFDRLQRLFFARPLLSCAGLRNKRVTKRPKPSFLASRGASDLPFSRHTRTRRMGLGRRSPGPAGGWGRLCRHGK